jgi:hypothetical protein
MYNERVEVYKKRVIHHKPGDALFSYPCTSIVAGQTKTDTATTQDKSISL